MDFYNADFRAQLTQLHKNLFDTYKRPEKIRFYLTPTETIVADPEYNADFDRFSQVERTYIENYADFDACIIYLDRQEFSDFVKGDDSNVRFKAFYNRIKVQVEKDAFEYLKNAERYVFGDEKYAIEQSWRKLGAFDFEYFEIILQRVA